MANQTVICRYRVKPEAEPEFLDLLRRHWPTLHSLGGVTDERARVYRCLEQSDPHLVEIFTWLDNGFRVTAHPDVIAIWERMEQLCEERDGRPAMAFPHFEEITL